MSLQRREFFVILGIGAAGAKQLIAQHVHEAKSAGINFSAYQPRALTRSEYQLLDDLVETLLPTDETGPGAHDAHVVYYIDVVLNHAPESSRQSWKAGLASVDALANSRFQQSFSACSALQKRELMAKLAANELMPQTEIDHFFVEMKHLAISAFYASELIQHEHLGYRGNTAISEFPGCTHVNFDHPDVA